MFPAGMLAPNDAGTFWDIGTAAKPVFFHSPAGQYTIVSNPSYVQSGKASLILYSSSIHVDGLIFMGNRLGSSDGNGAGIRPEVNYSSKGPNGFPLPYNLTVTNSEFIGNGNGILADDCSDTPGFDASYRPQLAPIRKAAPAPFRSTIRGSGQRRRKWADAQHVY